MNCLSAIISQGRADPNTAVRLCSNGFQYEIETHPTLFIGASLLTRWIGFDLGISRIRDVIGLVFAAACGTLVSATIGVATLTLAQDIPLASFSTLWITWLIGNLLGCLVITPLL